MNWWQEELTQKENHYLSRRLRTIPPGTLDLASNDYLGLASHPAIIEAACQAMRQHGAGARAARLVSGNTAIHTELEAALAKFRGSEAALLFPSGYHANLSAITALSRSGTLICCDKRNHASLIDACLLAGARGSTVRYYDSLEKLTSLLYRVKGADRLIVSDAVYSMDGDLAPVPELFEIAEKYDGLLILDDAHGTGTLGKTGRGALEHFQDAGWQPADMWKRLVLTGTLSKALASQGGFVAGRADLIQWLINAARPFIYTTGLNPGSCGAALAVLRHVQDEEAIVEALRDVKDKLVTGIRLAGFEVANQPSPIIPVIIGEAADAMRLSERLLEAGVWCPAIRPPTVPVGTSRLRVTANAALSDEHIAQVIEAFSTCR